MSMRIERPLILNHIVSPYGISILSTFIFCLAWLFPSRIYMELMHEPDFLFLDVDTLLFFLLCILSFWVGLFIVDFMFSGDSLLSSTPYSNCLGYFWLLLPLIITTAMTALVAIRIYNSYPNILLLLATQQGDVIKSQQASDVVLGPLGWASVVHTVVLWWTYWKIVDWKSRLTTSSKQFNFLPWLIFVVGVLTQIVLSTLKVSRSDLMPVFGGIAVLFLMSKVRRRKLGLAALIRCLLLGPVLILVFFSVFGLLRGTSDSYAGLQSFVGYTLASYNRLTALLHGTMHYPYSGHGIYLSVVLGYNHSLNALIPINETMGWPKEYLNFWNSDFQAPELSGLRYDLTWSGAFGYLFSDFGWGTPLILSGYGIIYGIFWKQAKAGTTLGIVLYPWLAFCALCWFSGNLIFDFRFPLFMAAALLLMLYERLLTLKFS